MDRNADVTVTYSTEGQSHLETPAHQVEREPGARRSEAPVAAGGERRATPATVLVLFLLVVVLFVTLGFLVGDRGLAGLLVAQVGGVLVPCLVYARWARLSWLRDLRLGAPSPRHVVGAMAAGSGTWYVLVSTVLWAQNQLIPPSEAFLEQRDSLFLSASGPAGWALLWVAAALAPAWIEEFFFRGLLLTTLQARLGAWRAVVVVAALFALFHMNGYQLVVTFLLGCLLGWLVIHTGSLWTAMLFHLVNNTVVLVASRIEGDSLPIPVVVLLVGLLLVGVWLLVRGAPGGHGSRVPVQAGAGLGGRNAQEGVGVEGNEEIRIR